MADPVKTSTTFVGSREKSRAGYGTNGDPNPSSVKTGVQPKLVNPSVAPPEPGPIAEFRHVIGNAHDDAKRLAEINAASPTAHPAMAPNTGSPSGKV